MTARAEWIPAKLELHSGYVFELRQNRVDVIAPGNASAVFLIPKTASEAAEISIALKRAQRRMDQIFRDMRAAEDASR